jgi:intracellular sulfur oxidation DsrE/DsrF family protein
MRAFTLFCLCLLVATAASAAPKQQRPVVAESDGYIAVPNAALKPVKTRIYRAVFDARQGPAKPSDLVPAVNFAAAELNTLVGAGMTLKNAQFAIVFHSQDADAGLLDNAHYRAKFGVDNPNLVVLAKLKKSGVKLYVCGQQLTFDGADFKTLSPDVTVVADGLLALTQLQNEGSAVLGF